MITANQGRDLQRLARLRADPELRLVRQLLMTLSSLTNIQGTKVYYTINTLLYLIDGHADESFPVDHA